MDSYTEMISFDKQAHTYHVNGSLYPSVSSLIKNWHEAFDTDTKAQLYADRHGLEVEEVLDLWAYKRDTALTKGNACHDLGENIAYLLKSDIRDTIGIIRFWAEMYDEDVEILQVEQPVFSLEFGYAGTPDLIVKQVEEDFGVVHDKTIMYDYKTNNNLYKNYKGKRMLAPFDDMLDSPFSKYTIQQNLYRIALAEHGIDIDEMYLVWTRGDQSPSYHRCYELVEVPVIEDLRDRIKYIAEKWQQ